MRNFKKWKDKNSKNCRLLKLVAVACTMSTLLIVCSIIVQIPHAQIGKPCGKTTVWKTTCKSRSRNLYNVVIK